MKFFLNRYVCIQFIGDLADHLGADTMGEECAFKSIDDDFFEVRNLEIEIFVCQHVFFGQICVRDETIIGIQGNPQTVIVVKFKGVSFVTFYTAGVNVTGHTDFHGDPVVGDVV